MHESIVIIISFHVPGHGNSHPLKFPDQLSFSFALNADLIVIKMKKGERRKVPVVWKMSTHGLSLKQNGDCSSFSSDRLRLVLSEKDHSKVQTDGPATDASKHYDRVYLLQGPKGARKVVPVFHD